MRRTEEQLRERALDKLSGTVVKAAGIRLSSNLNSGGWGTVYLGRLTAPSQSPGLLEPPSPESKIKRFVHRSLFRQSSRLFAVKVLQTADYGRDKGMQDEEARLHFLASSNRHPGIVKLHQVVREAKFTYFILDYCPGGDLFGAIMTKRFYGNIPAVKSIFTQLAEALQYLHGIGIFHRDLKPENVLITSQRDDPPTVAIADFGLSSDAPMTNIELGSIHYMSPECLGRYGKYFPEYSCAATDVWALGVVMLALVLDRVLPWYKAIDSCDAFREFCFDTHRWFMRRWNLSESFNALLVRFFELNPYHRIAASSIPHEVEKLDYFIATPEETQFALQRYSDAAADRRRERELAFLDGRCHIQPAIVFRAASPGPPRRSDSPGSNVLWHESSFLSAKRSDSPPRGIRRPNPDPSTRDTLGLTGMTTRPTADPADQVGGLSKAGPFPAHEDERWMQEVLIAAYRLEGGAADVSTTVFPHSQGLRQTSFVRRPSPLRSSLTLNGGNHVLTRMPGTGDLRALAASTSGEIKFGDAPPLVADDDDDDDDDDASSDGLDSSGMPSTPRNRLASIPELEGAVGVADSSSSPETRRGSLPRVRPMRVLGGLGPETFNPPKPSTAPSKAKAIQPDNMPEFTTGEVRFRGAVTRVV